jgi:hypothetical protein
MIIVKFSLTKSLQINLGSILLRPFREERWWREREELGGKKVEKIFWKLGELSYLCTPKTEKR